MERKEAILLGLKRFFTGRACRRGHVAERYIAGACVECIAELKVAYYAEHREKILAQRVEQGRKYREENPEKRRENARRWRANNPVRVRELHKAQYDKDPERRRAAVRESYYKHKQKNLTRSKAWRDANKGTVNHYTGMRRAALFKRTPTWLSEDDFWLIEEAYRLAQKRTSVTGVSWQVDHILPLRGRVVSGLHVPENIQVILGVENMRKGNRI